MDLKPGDRKSGPALGEAEGSGLRPAEEEV